MASCITNTSHDTSEFACDSVAAWWDEHGRSEYPGAKKILVLCDGSGSNSATRYVFKEELQKLAPPTWGRDQGGRTHPPYCSKYNPIEHRLFPHVTRACRGVIFRTLETARYYMAKEATRQTGLTVTVTMLEKVYEDGPQVRRRDSRSQFDDRLRQGVAKMELPRDPQQNHETGKLFPAGSFRGRPDWA